MISLPTATSGDAGPLRGRVHRPARRRHRRGRYPYLLAAAGLRAGTRLRPHRDLDEGARQSVGAQPDGLLELLTGQDWLSVTGSWETAYALRRHPVVAINAIRFTAEADSLNAVIRGEDVTPDDPEFAIFVEGLVAEMIQKAGQKCTAICRVFVPCKPLYDVEAVVSERLAKIIVWNPSDESVRMGPLASLRQREDVRASIAKLEAGGAGCSAIRSQSRKTWPRCGLRPGCVPLARAAGRRP